MSNENLRDLNAFVTVAREGSFTRAAARLGVSQSALSQTLRNLEERVGIRLLNRTTRNVSPTEAGERLLAHVTPALEEIEHGFAQIGTLLDRPSGTIRISADEYAIETVLWPRLSLFMSDYPEINIELVTDYGRNDIVRERFDAGVRRGKLVSKDMIAMRIGPDIPMAVVAAPSFLAGRKKPRTPQDLSSAPCINLRLPTHGELMAWTFSKGGKDLRITTEGRLVLTSVRQIRQASLAGFGFAYLPMDYVAGEIAAGHLVEVLADWRKTFEGYHLYYPNRRQQSPALAALVRALHYRVGASPETNR
ncbi:LysR family transcriptional regulator [Shinella zoogloeoides]|uniref:LysR family transcriptional regulator n=1 Tax=Shinella zoogloeoides TaxID=352475 RepID=A0A6N8TCP3_SHIZO|nr:LysR family transcriptional regulator [Shinella zoogloeoides]MXO01032.1 LysR family transcriptional regulator [Shinella zoogloeoides]UEX80556.1 LysR family transcriptional regulator [Shinella zoogloeoides]